MKRPRIRIRRATFIHDAFDIGIALKGIDGVLEVIGGFLLLFASPERVNRVVELLTKHELSKDPHDFFANYLVNLAHSFSTGAQFFASLFLFSHGVIKVFLVLSLWRKKLWAYPLAIVVFGLFVIYQMYRYFLSPSALLIVLSVLDVFIIVLTWLEYRRLRQAPSEA